jgi:aminomethyltransferase
MGTAWSYNTSPEDEHDAVREAAGLFDMSPLKKVYLRGPDAAKVVDHVVTRNMAKVHPGRSVYTAVLTEGGTVADDAIVANNGSNEWLMCHGSGTSMEKLQESANGLEVDIELDDNLHDLALQGPKAIELLSRHTPMDLQALGYFHHQNTELFGHPVQLSRTGYSGERGYEIFADQSVIGDIWDNILGHGADMGVMPASFTALDKVRIEAGLLFYGYDMTDEHTPWEVGLGFTVSPDKGDFRGKSAVLESKGHERFKLAGISVDHAEDLAGGEELIKDDAVVGVVNSPGWSHRLQKSLALTHLNPALNVAGTVLKVVGEGIDSEVRVETLPFYDPEKQRTHA